MSDSPPIGTFEQIEEMLTSADVAAVWMELGSRGHLAAADAVRAAQAVHDAIGRLSDRQTLILSIGGFDEDPRSLWDVPEVVQFIRGVMRHAGIVDWRHPAVRTFNNSTVSLLVLCGAFGSDHPFRVDIKPGAPVSFDRYRPTR